MYVCVRAWAREHKTPMFNHAHTHAHAPTQANQTPLSAVADLSYIRDWTPRTFPGQEQQQQPSSTAMDDFRRSVNDASSIRDELYLTLDP